MDKKIKTHYPSGKLKSTVPSKGAWRHGHYKEYYESGKLKYEGEYKDQKQEGVWKLYYENGKLKRENIFRDNEKISVKEWNEEGDLIKEKSSEFYITKIKSEYGLGIRNTLIFTIITLITFFFSLMIGFILTSILIFLSYKLYESMKSSMDTLKNRFYPNGQLKSESDVHFRCHGCTTIYISSSWYENGQLKSNSMTNNYSKEWYENGQLKSETIYKNDKFISRKRWSKNGEERKK